MGDGECGNRAGQEVVAAAASPYLAPRELWRVECRAGPTSRQGLTYRSFTTVNH